jgi:hypothetical protein
MERRGASSVLRDKRIPMKLKDKFYRSVVRLTMPYGLKYWAVDKIEQSMSVAGGNENA